MKNLFLSILLSLGLVTSAVAQQNATHRVTLGGEVSFERHSAWRQGSIEYSEVCSKEIGCVRGEETPQVARANLGGQTFEIRKSNLTGKRLYHDILGTKVLWNVFKNGQRVGSWDVTFVRTLQDGSRVYEENFSIPELNGSATTRIYDLTLIAQDGNVNGIQFSVRKL